MPLETQSRLHPADDGEAEARFPEAVAILRQAIVDGAFPGCSFGVFARGQVLARCGLGRFTYDEVSPQVEFATLYDIASLTKVVAATAMAMLLFERGQLDLETPVGDLLPGFVVGRESTEGARRITLRHLLAHSSGLPGYRRLYQIAATPSELMRANMSLPIEAPPGARVEYSDHGFMLLGKALEVLTQEDMATFLHREVFVPLGMSQTSFCPPIAVRSRIPPTEKDELYRGRIIQGVVQDEHAYRMNGVSGHAGLFSNVPDLLRFSQAILHPSPEIKSVFKQTTIELFSRRQEPVGSSRALGWDTPSEPSSSGRYFSANSIGHLGFSGCSLWIDLEEKLAAVLLTNRTWPNRESQAIKEVRPAFHDALLKSL